MLRALAQACAVSALSFAKYSKEMCLWGNLYSLYDIEVYLFVSQLKCLDEK